MSVTSNKESVKIGETFTYNISIDNESNKGNSLKLLIPKQKSNLDFNQICSYQVNINLESEKESKHIKVTVNIIEKKAESPVDPGKPEKPEKPDVSAKPIAPEKPEEPGKPVEPEKPAKVETMEKPFINEKNIKKLEEWLKPSKDFERKEQGLPVTGMGLDVIPYLISLFGIVLFIKGKKD